MKDYIVEIANNRVIQLIECEESLKGGAMAKSIFARLATENGCLEGELETAVQEGIDKLEKEFDFKPTFTLLHLDMDLQGADDGQLTNVIITGFAKYKSDDKNGILQFTFEAEFPKPKDETTP